ncbi:hypothetical protein SAMN05192576_1015 [Nocardioides szechwanensis]|uniref:Uncharacterized protein n=1 Tax=Nocardioides szechwanensis TaxID=1005944 RepID=A0A1G9WCH9_9ACTN|nr:hypothetical protein SAMN05192576_1015 [Nocardioides szechwanensis]
MLAPCLAKPGAWEDWPWGGDPEADHGQDNMSDHGLFSRELML